MPSSPTSPAGLVPLRLGEGHDDGDGEALVLVSRLWAMACVSDACGRQNARNCVQCRPTIRKNVHFARVRPPECTLVRAVAADSAQWRAFRMGARAQMHVAACSAGRPYATACVTGASGHQNARWCVQCQLTVRIGVRFARWGRGRLSRSAGSRTTGTARPPFTSKQGACV